MSLGLGVVRGGWGFAGSGAQVAVGRVGRVFPEDHRASPLATGEGRCGLRDEVRRAPNLSQPPGTGTLLPVTD
jgi:hypothetical protein